MRTKEEIKRDHRTVYNGRMHLRSMKQNNKTLHQIKKRAEKRRRRRHTDIAV